VVIDRSTNAYWVSPCPGSWDIINSAPVNTKSDPAILQIGQIVPKATERDLSVPKIIISEASVQEAVLEEKSVVALETDNATLVELSSSHTKIEFSVEELEAAISFSTSTSVTDALDLAEPVCDKVPVPDYLDLALTKDQTSELESRLLAVDKGRLATVPETLAEAYVQNAKELKISAKVPGCPDEAWSTRLASNEVLHTASNEAYAPASGLGDLSRSLLSLEHPLFIDDSNAQRLTVALPRRSDGSWRPFVNTSSISSIEPVAIVATSCEILEFTRGASEVHVNLPWQDIDGRQPLVKAFSEPSIELVVVNTTTYEDLTFTRGPSKANVNLRGSLNYEQGTATPVVASAEQIHARQPSDGNASTTTVESLPEQVHSRQPSDGNVSITTVGSEMAEAEFPKTTDPSRSYPQPHVRVEEPYIATTEPLLAGSEQVQFEEVTLDDSSPTCGQAEPEKENLSKSQKKRRRQGRKRRALAAAAAEQSAIDRPAVVSDTSSQPQLDKQEDESDKTLKVEGQSLSPILEDQALLEGPRKFEDAGCTGSVTTPSKAEQAKSEQSSFTPTTTSNTVPTVSVPSTQIIASETLPVEGPAPQAAVFINQPSIAVSSGHTNIASSTQLAPLDVETTEIANPPLKESIQDQIDALFGGEFEDWADSVEDEPARAKARKVFEEGNPQGKFDHSNMHFAMQHLRQPGFAQVRILQEADRSLAWFQRFFSSGSASATQIIEVGEAEDLIGATNSVPVLSTQKVAAQDPLPDFHHLNFLYEKVKNKSATPPEVSLWAAITHNRLLKEKQGLPWACSTKAVLIAQAWQYVDPYSYTGPIELLMLQGTQLRDAVTGYVDKVYEKCGTWGYDFYDEDENVPRADTDVQHWCHCGQDEKYGVVMPYHMGNGDIIVIWDPKPITELRRLLHYIPSPLGPSRIVYDTKKAADILASTGLPEATEVAECASIGDCDLSEEEIKADNHDFYCNDPNGSDVQDEASNYADASNEELLVSEEQDMSEQEADASAAIRKQEWLAEWSDSPDRIRNQFMNPTDTPGMFKHRLISDEEQAPSEASTEIDIDQNYDCDLGTDYNDHRMDDTQAMDPAAKPLVFESPGDTYLETVIEEEDEDRATELVLSVGQEASLETVRTFSHPRPGNELTIYQIKQESSPQPSTLGSNVSSMSPAGIDSHRISDAEAHAPLLSHIFPFLTKDISWLPDVSELQHPAAEVVTDAPAVNNSEVATVDTSPEPDNMPLPSPSDDDQEVTATVGSLGNIEEPRASSAEVYYYQVSDAETLATNLSHVFPFLLKDASLSPEAVEVLAQTESAQVPSEAASVTTIEVAGVDTSLECDSMPVLSFSHESREDSGFIQPVADDEESEASLTEFYGHQISDAETPSPPLSHIFPFLLKDASSAPEPLQVHNISATISRDLTPTRDLKVTMLDTSFESDDVLLPPTSKELQQSSSGEEATIRFDRNESEKSSAEIDINQISDAETLVAPLSHVFPFLAKNDSPKPDPGAPTVDHTHVSPTTNFENATKDPPLNTDNLLVLSPSDNMQEDSASLQSVAHDDESPIFFCEIDKHQISSPETSAVPLSHVFPFLSQNASTSQELSEAQNTSTVVLNDPTPATDIKNASNENTPSGSGDAVPLPSSPEDIPQQASSEDDSKQAVLYEPRPRWFNILMLFARTLKRATNILHKSTSVEPTATEILPHEVNLDIPDNLDLIPNRPDFNEFYFGKSTIYVGKQGIKVAKAAVQVGMLPVHAGVEVAKTPYKAAKTGWKIGNWAWSRFVRRR